MEKDYVIWQKKKQSPGFSGAYEILEMVRQVAYKMAIPLELEKIHNVFHVSIVKRYYFYPYCLLPVESIEIILTGCIIKHLS